MPNSYLHFSRRERIGIASLLALIVLTGMVPRVWGLLYTDVETIDTAAFQRTALALDAMMKADTLERKVYPAKTFKRNFYRDSFPKYERTHVERYKRITSLNINTADTTLWDKLPGIGPVLARRIVTFREHLGGFYSVAQVAETFGLPDSTFVKIQPLLQLGNVSLRKIDVNHTDEKSLADHPYIDTKLARAIIRYRSSHGPFRAVEDLKGLALVDDVIYRKIENYLVVK